MRLLITALLAALAAPAAASAASVQVVASGDPRLVTVTVLVTGAGAERNRVDVAAAGGAIEVRDAGAPLTAGSGCTPAGAVVRCGPSGGRSGFDALSVDLGRGDDHLLLGDLAGLVTIGGIGVLGGPGDDLLVGGGARLESLAGGPGRDELRGGDGDDTLRGDAGRDVLRGGAGEDELVGGTGRDVLDGGLGRDVVSYAERVRPVRVDLTRSGAGERGEGDRLRAVEGAVGGAGRDVLLGDAGPNRLLAFAPGLLPPRAGDRISGRGGDDVIEGDAGDDRLAGGAGADTITGRYGDDVITAGDGDDLVLPSTGRHRIDLGAGDDRVNLQTLGDRLPAPLVPRIACGAGEDAVQADVLRPAGRPVQPRLDAACEGIRLGDGFAAVSGSVTATARPAVGSRGVTVGVRCERSPEQGPCEGDATVVAGGRRASAAYSLAPGAAGDVTLALTPAPGAPVEVRLALQRGEQTFDVAWFAPPR